MPLQFSFYFNSIFLGIGLAMDAFSASLADGVSEPRMKTRKMCAIAGVFAFFQALMPLIGWVCVHTVLEYFKVFEKLIPWIALALLSFIGGKMIYECVKCNTTECQLLRRVTLSALIVQGIATSIDALSVGFTIADYNALAAILCALIIALVTFIICMIGVALGQKAGTRWANAAGYIGGGILIFIGIEIFVTSWL